MRQWTLGNLKTALEMVPDQNERVKFDFEEAYPVDFHSWRGYYRQISLAFELGGYNARQHASTHVSTVEEFLLEVNAAIGSTFSGWKGGEYLMDKDTPIWVANWGNAGNTALTGLIGTRYSGIILRTSYCEYRPEK